MRRHLPWISALVATLYLTLTLWTDRTKASMSHLSDLGGSLLAAVASVAVGWWLSRFLTDDANKRGIIALIVGIWGPMSASVQLALALGVSPVFESGWVAAGSWTATCALLAFAISRVKVDLSFTSRMLFFASLFLAALQVNRVFTLRAATVAKQVTARARPAGVPDVYVIVMDKYSSGQWMRHTYGVDQTPFEDSLRALGFVVPRAARVNYAHTHLSLASFLNWRYLELPADAEGGRPWGQTRQLIAKARTWQEFRDRGYRLFSFPSWFAASNVYEGAEVMLRWAGTREAKFAETWWVNSPLAMLLEDPCLPPRCRGGNTTPYPIETLEEIDWKLQVLTQLPDSTGPVMAFLHLLVPHEPYLFDDSCTPVEPWWPHTDQGESYDVVGTAYANQVRCFAPRVLNTVRTLLAKSETPPVIIIQSDHGHSRMFTNLLRGFTLTYDELTREQVGERHGVFAAYRFPGADTLMTDDISAVNVMPAVGHALWGLPYRRQPDRAYFSAYQSIFDFIEVPAAVTVPPATP